MNLRKCLAGLYPVGVMLAFWIQTSCTNVVAAASRTNWVFQHLTMIPTKSRDENKYFQFSAGVTTLSDTLSTRGAGLFSLGKFELMALAGQCVSLGLSSDNVQTWHTLDKMRTLLGVELARRYVSKRGAFGRFGIGFLELLPGNQSWLGISLSTGILELPDNPWSISFLAHFYLHPNSTHRYLTLGTETGKALLANADSQLSLGFRLHWTYHISGEAELPVAEHMLFSVGPYLSWTMAFGRIVGAINARIWLDKETLVSGKHSYPTDIRLPDLSLSWVVDL